MNESFRDDAPAVSFSNGNNLEDKDALAGKPRLGGRSMEKKSGRSNRGENLSAKLRSTATESSRGITRRVAARLCYFIPWKILDKISLFSRVYKLESI